jgi:hypothetical protein
MYRILALVVVCVFLACPSFAQTLGTIGGEVRDSSGAIVPGATITATNKATNATREAQSNTSGEYNFAAMQPGVYDVKAELPGFRTVTQAVELQVAGAARLNFKMEVGELAESMVVSAVAPLISTENATVGTVIENRRIVELPLNGRNYLSLVALSPNVSAEFAGAGQAGDRQGGTRSQQQLSISGQRREFNYFTLDGVDNTDVNFNTYIFLPSVDALEEFKVQTGIYSAEFGRAASQVNVVTKSGSNNLHGSVFEFHRNDALDSRPYAFTAAQAAQRKAPFKWNQYGYTAGGPVWRNKLFFMSNFEGYKDRKQSQTNFTVPSVAMRNGDFSSLATPLLDPATCVVVGSTRNCSAFPNNQIPANRIDPVSKKLLEFYPEPNAAGATLNYVSLQNRVINKNQYTQRMDFVQSSASTWMGRYSYGQEDEVQPALKLNGTKLLNHIHQVMLGNTRTLGPTVVNEFRFGYNYFFNTFGRELAFERDVVSELAIPGMVSIPPEAWGIPSVGVTGYSSFGDNTEGPYTNRNSVFEVIDNVSWIRGKHAFKAGGSLRMDKFNQVGNQFPRGGFGFNGTATSATATPANPNAFADYLLGYIRQSELAVALATAQFRALSQSYYFTDTWRMTSNMTADLGIRYEYTPPWLDKSGTLMNAYLPAYDSMPNVQDLSRHPVLVRIGQGNFYENSPIRFNPAIQTARDGRLGGRLINDDKLNFAPRVGWAWTPTSKYSVRAGAGIFYMQDTGNPRFDMARNAAGRRQDTSNPLGTMLTWKSPFLGGSDTGNACNVAPPLVCISNHYVLGNMYDRRTPYMFQYLFNIQRELGRSTALEVGYLGSRSHRLERMFDRNEVVPANPAVDSSSVQLRRPYPEFTKVQEIGNVAEAKYNSLAVKLTRRLDNGLSALVGYTYSKSTDNGSGIRVLNGDPLFPQNSNCFECEWGLSVFDVRHRLVSSILYELPFGEGKPFAKDGLGSALLGGWQISTIISKSGGFPRNITSGSDRSNTGAGYDRANLVPGQDPNAGPQTIQQWFNTNAFALNAPGTYGNAPRNIVIGPGIFNFDSSIIRNFRMRGGKSLQFRLETFNLFNQPVWNDPVISMANAATFGTITSTRKPMREVQVGLKFNF